MGKQADTWGACMVAMGVAAMRGPSTVPAGAPVVHTGTGGPSEKNLNGSEPGADSGSPVRFPAPSAPENGRETASDPRRK